jgi:hypothetical protein
MSRVHFDTIYIDPASPAHVQHWSKELQVSPSELKAAVITVGRRLTDLRRYFGKTAEIICLHDRRDARKTKESTWTAFPPVA